MYIVPANAAAAYRICLFFLFPVTWRQKSIMLMTSTHLFPGQMEENAPSECAQIKSYFLLVSYFRLDVLPIFSLLPPLIFHLFLLIG